MVTWRQCFNLRELAVGGEIRGAFFQVTDCHSFWNPSQVTRQTRFHGEAKGHFTSVANRDGVHGADVIQNFSSFFENDDATGFS